MIFPMKDTWVQLIHSLRFQCYSCNGCCLRIFSGKLTDLLFPVLCRQSYFNMIRHKLGHLIRSRYIEIIFCNFLLFYLLYYYYYQQQQQQQQYCCCCCCYYYYCLDLNKKTASRSFCDIMTTVLQNTNMKVPLPIQSNCQSIV